VFLDLGLILYVGPGDVAARHAHHAVQLAWSRDAALSVTTGGDAHRRRAVLVPANAPHALDAAGQTIALLLVEPHGERGTALDRAAHATGGRDLARELAALPFPSPDIALADVVPWCDRVLAALGVTPQRPALSSVSRRAIAHIERCRDGVPRVADVATALALSTTRVTHLFSAEVGIPFRRFVLWTRIKRAVAAVQAGRDLTAAAIAAGFSDAAHFSRTFRAMFGLSPSLVLPHAELTGAMTRPQ
jgi:AraC-like DNA-binding protein